MSNNAPDYNDNLAFPPNNKTDVEKKLDIAVKALKDVVDTINSGFVTCDRCNYSMECKNCWCEDIAQQALKEIEG